MSPPTKSQLSRAQLLALMAYADGEVDPHELPGLEAELAGSPESVQAVQSFRGLGAHVRASLAITPDLTDAILAKVAGGAPVRPAHVEGAKVLDLSAARARRFKVGAAVASLAAMAAAVALWVNRPADSFATQLGAAATAAMGVQVQQVDSQAMVYSIPALHSNASSVVVWLGDETEESTAKPSDAAPQPSTKASVTP